MYGIKWTNNFANQEILNLAKTHWDIGLKGFTPKQIQLGIQLCMKSGKEFPPSLPLFIQYCKSSNQSYFGPLVKLSELPAPDRLRKNLIIGRTTIAQIKVLLRA